MLYIDRSKEIVILNDFFRENYINDKLLKSINGYNSGFIDFSTFFDNTKNYISSLVEYKIIKNDYRMSLLYENWNIQGRRLNRLDEIKNKVISFINNPKYNINGNRIVYEMLWDMLGFVFIYYPVSYTKLKDKKDKVMLTLNFNLFYSGVITI